MANPLSALPLPKFQKPLPSNPQTLADIQHVLKCGYIILHNQFSPSDAAAARAEIARLSGSTPQNGRNPFEGLKTNRIYSLFNKTRFFDKYTILPRVLALNDYFLDPGFNISSFHTIVIKPGEKPQPLHFDDQFCHIPRPRVPLGTAIIVAFDDFTEKNGATRVVPGSHLWGGERVPTFEESIPAGCPEGSVIFFVSTMWHGGGPNETEQGRQSLTVQYCQPYIRQIENQFLSVDPRKLDSIPPQIVDMMGYRTHAPFIGYVDGLGPREGARRMVRWFSKEVDPSPPAFAHYGDGKGSKL